MNNIPTIGFTPMRAALEANFHYLAGFMPHGESEPRLFFATESGRMDDLMRYSDNWPEDWCVKCEQKLNIFDLAKLDVKRMQMSGEGAFAEKAAWAFIEMAREIIKAQGRDTDMWAQTVRREDLKPEEIEECMRMLIEAGALTGEVKAFDKNGELAEKYDDLSTFWFGTRLTHANGFVTVEHYIGHNEAVYTELSDTLRDDVFLGIAADAIAGEQMREASKQKKAPKPRM